MNRLFDIGLESIVLFALTLIATVGMSVAMLKGSSDIGQITAADQIQAENEFWLAISGDIEPADNAFGQFARDILPLVEGSEFTASQEESRIIPTSLDEAVFAPVFVEGLPVEFLQSAMVDEDGSANYVPATESGVFTQEFQSLLQLVSRGDAEPVLTEVPEVQRDTFAMRTFTFQNLVIVFVGGMIITGLATIAVNLFDMLRQLMRRRQARKLLLKAEREHPQAGVIAELRKRASEVDELQISSDEKQALRTKINAAIDKAKAHPDAIVQVTDRHRADNIAQDVDWMVEELGIEVTSHDAGLTEINQL